MIVILSRKGFDSATGGYPSPILPDGTLLSLPIPAKDKIHYSDIKASKDFTYYDIMLQLKQKVRLNNRWKPLTKNIQCHLDPDLIKSAYKRASGWKPLFGQIGKSQIHLFNKNVKEGDLFLFFGLFRKTVLQKDKLVFDRNSNPIHIIFGYLQIGKIHYIDIDYEVLKWMEYHPHTAEWRRFRSNNVVCEAAHNLSFNPKLPGAGVLKYSPAIVLTKSGLTTSKWELPNFFRSVKISYHSDSTVYGWKEDYFQSALRGQEFVIEENKSVSKWAKSLIVNSRVK